METYTHEFKTSFHYMGKDYTELHFDWGRLTGNDDLEIEAELAATGKAAALPEYSGEYHIRLAARACTENIGHDAFSLMRYADARAIKRQARRFMLASE
jgi:hypothetical protein